MHEPLVRGIFVFLLLESFFAFRCIRKLETELFPDWRSRYAEVSGRFLDDFVSIDYWRRLLLGLISQ